MLEHLYLFVLLVFVGFYLLSKFDFKRLWKIKKKEKKTAGLGLVANWP